MDVSLNWLKEYAPFDCGVRQFSEAMTMSGTKVEVYSTEKDSIKNVVIGRVLSLEKHPDADKLTVCSIDVGSETLTIVTGAANLKVGDLIPVALDGSSLPCGKEIHTGDLRGVTSHGMLCSLSELGFTKHDFPNAVEDGIMVLDEDCALGTPCEKALGMDDYMVEFEITPNRPDCLSVLGIAREAAVTFNVPFTPPVATLPKGTGDINELLSVKVTDDKHCLRYCAGMIKNVRVKPSPRWLREKLRLCGVRPINNIVDITNYVMLLYGHPMHAFDYKYVQGSKIEVRMARPQETIQTLDGIERKLNENMLVIADEKDPIALAGVMGGEHSGVYEDTNMVVFESACFDGPKVRYASRTLGLRTEASGKFEKGLNPENCSAALAMAMELVVELDAGDIIGGTIDVYTQPRTVRTVPFDVARINKILGTSLSRKAMEDILIPLDFAIDGDNVTVPTHRYDIAKDALTQYNDLAEEIARIYGYNKLPATIMKGSATARPTPRQGFTQNMVKALLGLGFYEIETFSFYSPKNFDLLNLPLDSDLRNPVVISNPLGEDTSIMRTTAIASMMNVVQRNYNSRHDSVALFENATEYRVVTGQELPQELDKFIMACYGEDKDFFFIKGALEKILWSFNIEDVKFVRRTQNSTYHPGRCADVLIGEDIIATIGELHPTVLNNYGIKAKVCVCDIDADKLFCHLGAVKQYKTLARFPAMTRDIALVCDMHVSSGEIIDIIKASCGTHLESVKLFDVYTGDRLESGKKSLAYSLVLRDQNATLTDSIADECMGRILANLEKIGIFLRR
ncbi:MAG: phenylalanine--tRNA ligase subunit beta [Oscillospiraceae bacterium]